MRLNIYYNILKWIFNDFSFNIKIHIFHILFWKRKVILLSIGFFPLKTFNFFLIFFREITLGIEPPLLLKFSFSTISLLIPKFLFFTFCLENGKLIHFPSVFPLKVKHFFLIFFREITWGIEPPLLLIMDLSTISLSFLKFIFFHFQFWKWKVILLSIGFSVKKLNIFWSFFSVKSLDQPLIFNNFPFNIINSYFSYSILKIESYFTFHRLLTLVFPLKTLTLS